MPSTPPTATQRVDHVAHVPPSAAFCGRWCSSSESEKSALERASESTTPRHAGHQPPRPPSHHPSHHPSRQPRAGSGPRRAPKSAQGRRGRQRRERPTICSAHWVASTLGCAIECPHHRSGSSQERRSSPPVRKLENARSSAWTRLSCRDCSAKKRLSVRFLDADGLLRCVCGLKLIDKQTSTAVAKDCSSKETVMLHDRCSKRKERLCAPPGPP